MSKTERASEESLLDLVNKRLCAQHAENVAPFVPSYPPPDLAGEAIAVIKKRVKRGMTFRHQRIAFTLFDGDASPRRVSHPDSDDEEPADGVPDDIIGTMWWRNVCEWYVKESDRAYDRTDDYHTNHDSIISLLDELREQLSAAWREDQPGFPCEWSDNMCQFIVKSPLAK